METNYHPQALTADQLSALSQEVKRALTDLYGARLDRVILYGSYARGDFHAESDVDYMVVLQDESIKSGYEVRFIAPSVGLLALKYEVEISVFPVSATDYSSQRTAFYNPVQHEGICA